MTRTSVTVVLIGSDTAGKKWIDYEITSSHKIGNGILGIHVHNVKDSNSKTSTKGKNPFSNWKFTRVDKTVIYTVYDWVNGDGYKNLGDWIEKAAKDSGKYNHNTIRLRHSCFIK